MPTDQEAKGGGFLALAKRGPVGAKPWSLTRFIGNLVYWRNWAFALSIISITVVSLIDPVPMDMSPRLWTFFTSAFGFWALANYLYSKPYRGGSSD